MAKTYHEPSPTVKAGYAFCEALRQSAVIACDQKSPETVYYMMKRLREIEGTLRTIERMEDYG